MTFIHQRRYFSGASIALIVYIFLRLLNGGHLGVANIPLLVLMFGPFLPLLVPFILLGFKKREMALGALVVSAVTFIVGFFV